MGLSSMSPKRWVNGKFNLLISDSLVTFIGHRREPQGFSWMSGRLPPSCWHRGSQSPRAPEPLRDALGQGRRCRAHWSPHLPGMNTGSPPRFHLLPAEWWRCPASSTLCAPSRQNQINCLHVLSTVGNWPLNLQSQFLKFWTQQCAKVKEMYFSHNCLC